MTRVSTGFAACIRHVASTATPRESRPLSQTTAHAATGLLYAQVVKTRDHGRIVQVESKVVFGDPKAIAEKLTLLPTSATINTRFVERHNSDAASEQSSLHTAHQWLLQGSLVV